MPHFILEMGLGAGLNQANVSSLWDKLLDPTVVFATEKKFLKEGKLYVRVSSSVVRNFLFTKRTSIIEQINEAAGKRLVTEIILH